MTNLEKFDSAVIRHLTPTALAILSVELEAAERTRGESEFLDAVNEALTCNVGEVEAEDIRRWVRENL